MTPHGDLFGETTPPKHRLFFAAVPDDDAREPLDRCIRELRAAIPRARWVRPSRQHVTLHYLGESAGRRDDWIDAAINAVHDWTPSAFDLHLDHLRALGNPRRPALALAASALSPEVEAFWHELQRRTLRAGLRPPREHGFLAHLTLAYTDPAPPVPPVPPVAPITLRARAFRLLLSVQDEDEHQCLHEWPLSPA